MIILAWKESTPDEELKLIKRVVKIISKYNLETASIFLLEWLKPMVYIMGGLSRLFLAPFFIMVGDEANTFLTTFEKRNNIEKLVEFLENEIQQKNT